jgi:uncharacterized membrane protein
MGAHAMICTMGMLPHPGLGGGMMGGQGMGGMMQQGAAAGGMQHGAMGGVRQDSAARPGAMQHGAMGGTQHGAAAQGAGQEMPGIEHPITPTMLIHHAKELELTAEQQAKVTQLARTSQASCETHLKAAAESHKAASTVLDNASVDVGAYQGRLREAADHAIEAHVAVVKAGVDAAALLSPAQREKLAATARAHGK